MLPDRGPNGIVLPSGPVTVPVTVPLKTGRGAIGFRQADRRLAAQYRRREHVGRDDKAKCPGSLDVGVYLRLKVHGDIFDLELFCQG